MPESNVSIMHPSYERNMYAWTMVRDAVEGESAVKSKGTMYLPMPAAMQFSEYQANPPAIKRRSSFSRLPSDPMSQKMASYMMDPNWDPNPAFSAYLMRAQFPELCSFIIRGLTGLSMSEEPTFTLPAKMEYLRDFATPSGMTLVQLYYKAVIETLMVGRFTLMLTIDSLGIIRIIPYTAESLINWKERKTTDSKASNASFLVFEEYVDDPVEFSHAAEAEYFVARDIGNQFIVEHYKGNTESPETITVPSFMGKTLPYIPFVTIGSVASGLSVSPIPMYSIASTSVQIYMRSADLGNSEFLSCNPTLVMTGVDKEESPKALGSTVVITLPNDMAKVFYTTTDTSALNHVMQHINDLFERAVFFGAHLLDSSKKAAESAETMRLKQASSGATLASVVHNVAESFEAILLMAAEWMSIAATDEGDEVSVEAVTDFMAPALTAAEQKSMVESWTAGAISKFTLIDNFRRAGVLPAGSSVDDEIARISAEGPTPAEKAATAAAATTIQTPPQDKPVTP